MQKDVLLAQEKRSGRNMRMARARKNFVFIPLIAVIAGAIAFSFTTSSGVSLITGNSVNRTEPFVWIFYEGVNSVIRWSLGTLLFVLIAGVAIFLWFPGRSFKSSRWVVWKCVRTFTRSCYGVLKAKRK